MEFSELIQKRYSVRAYKSKPVEQDKLSKVLGAAILAPTAANRQAFRLIVIKTEGRQAELKRIYGREWFVQAPLVVCACAVNDEAWVRRDGKNYAEVDATIAFTHLILAAHDLGLGTCWIAAFDPAAARDVLKLPAELDPVAFTPLGYPADEWKKKKRRPASDLIQHI
ncbi:MAG: nitroreductase family protein [Candidatus Aminicenantes bacterium]|nr:nitroreductase family protein [Candidatus Aminicenantes bacterium]